MHNTDAQVGRRDAIGLVLLLVLAPIPSLGWGAEGHLMINQIAASYVPAEMPSFFRKGGPRLAYLATEPDRWRDKQDVQLKYAQEPEHFIDLERVDWMSEFPRDRWQFVHALYEKRTTAANPDDLLPEKVGLLPYETMEVYQRLRNAFRQYRQLRNDHEHTAAVEQDIVFYAGWLGHYVADTSQPLHTTIHYDGWVGPNPKGYAIHLESTGASGLHWKFEGPFVAQNIKTEDVMAHMHPAERLSNPFRDYLKFLHASHSLVERLYQLDKAKAFDGAGTPEGKGFAAEDMAAGAQMLVNMWYTAWLESAEGEQKSGHKPIHRLQVPAAHDSERGTKNSHF
jgi:S1/P1 Nuclease